MGHTRGKSAQAKTVGSQREGMGGKFSRVGVFSFYEHSGTWYGQSSLMTPHFQSLTVCHIHGTQGFCLILI
uniref:Uncharacterized protein n=1 Tax=Anguilla anguilla TaxID=7936 RepID=A0A0E9XAB9_ANGAN